jgi:threonine aldolase
MLESTAVELYSDTQTRPTPQMRRFMAEAEVGDEQRGEDPSVNLLQEMVAEMLGKESALFLPSGTMANVISLAVHCQPGDEVIMDRSAHPFNSEAGALAAVAGSFAQPLDGEWGVFTAEQLEDAVRPDSRYSPRTRAVSVEQTANLAGGTCWPMGRIEEVCRTAKEHGLATHMDGARLMNAVVATGVTAREHAAPFDSVWLDLSKSLGAPVGAVLAGSEEFIAQAWRWKQRLGGAMRQAGLVASAGVYALTHHVERLAEDHYNAKALAEGLAELPGVSLDPRKVETNIVIFDVSGTGMSAEKFAERAFSEHGINLSVAGAAGVRAVTHLDVDREGIDLALESLWRMLA